MFTFLFFLFRRIEIVLREVFSDPRWLSFEEEKEPSRREMLELENTEYSYGHDINYRGKDYE